MSHQSPFMRHCIAGHQPFSLQRTGCPNSKCKNLLPRHIKRWIIYNSASLTLEFLPRNPLLLWTIKQDIPFEIIDLHFLSLIGFFFLIYYFFPFSCYHLALLCQIQTLVVDFIFITHYWAMMWQMKSFMIFFNQTFLLSELQWE